MDNDVPDMNQHFWMLVVSLQAGAMQQMGKVASPISGEIERNLEAARATIDTLVMLEEKTQGNLSGDEGKFLSSVLYQLRLNFVDESKKGDQTEKSDSGTDESDEQNDTNEGDSADSESKRSDD
jgi:hypothetical protein